MAVSLPLRSLPVRRPPSPWVGASLGAALLVATLPLGAGALWSVRSGAPAAALSQLVGPLPAPAPPPPESAPAPPPARGSGLSAESIARAEAILAQPLPVHTTPVLPSASHEAAAFETVSVADPEVAATEAPPDDATREWRQAIEVLPFSHLRPRVGGWQGEFIHALGLTARHTPGTDRIPPSVTIAQAILDTGWGRSELGYRYHNYFGVKAFGRGGTAGTVRYATVEYVNGEPVWEYAAFRAYRSMADAVADHHRFLHENPRYRGILALGRKDPAGFARGLQKAGYATDPWYAQKLLALMDRYDLYRYDR